MKKIALFVFVALFAINAQAQKKAKKAVAKKEAAAAVVAPISKDPSIFLSSDVVDYGEIKKGAEGTKEVEVVNKGSQPLLLTSCNGSCGCTVPTCPREPIMPGKSAKISIKYDTSRVGPINKQVTVLSNDPANASKIIVVKGNVVE
jgi:hypothetical protein